MLVLWQSECMFGGQVDSLETMKQAAQELHKLGPRFVLVKGGHLIDEAKSEDASSSGTTRARCLWHTPGSCHFEVRNSSCEGVCASAADAFHGHRCPHAALPIPFKAPLQLLGLMIAELNQRHQRLSTCLRACLLMQLELLPGTSQPRSHCFM